MTPPADPASCPAGCLAAYLTALAAESGYDIDLDELDPVTGFHPELVLAWAVAGARHAGLAYTRSLLAGPVAFFREQVGPHDPQHNTGDDPGGHSDDSVATHVDLLAGLIVLRDRLDHDLAAAAYAYTAACRALAGTGLGVAWSRQPQPDYPPPGPPATTA